MVITADRTAAVVVTYNRRSVLEQTLAGILRQVEPPGCIVVVDNASSDDTTAVIGVRGDITYVRLPENLGYAAGLAAGIERATQMGYEAFWLSDDDSVPAPQALQTLLTEYAQAGVNLGLLGQAGGLFRHGLIQHLHSPESLKNRPTVTPMTRKVDFVLVDGALLSRAAMEQAGPPDEKMFMMFEDIEFSWRIGQAGFEIAVLTDDLMTRAHLGSLTPINLNGPFWRRYYLARNQTRWALETKRPMIVLGTFLRFSRMFLGSIRHRQWNSLGYLIAGIRDGILRRTGRTIQPGDPIPWRAH